MDNFEYSFTKMSPHKIEETLYSLVQESLYAKYSEASDDLIVSRIKAEWYAMKCCNVISDVAALYELTIWLKKNHYPYRMRALSGSSFTLISN